jgi:hypothetical protein
MNLQLYIQDSTNPLSIHLLFHRVFYYFMLAYSPQDQSYFYQFVFLFFQ